jgi:hypothetical protein
VSFQVLKLIHFETLMKAVAIVKEQKRLHTCSRWWISNRRCEILELLIIMVKSRFCKTNKLKKLPFGTVLTLATGEDEFFCELLLKLQRK